MQSRNHFQTVLEMPESDATRILFQFVSDVFELVLTKDDSLLGYGPVSISMFQRCVHSPLLRRWWQYALMKRWPTSTRLQDAISHSPR
jgi:hypothetical protein